MTPKTITLGYLRESLSEYPDDTEIYFGVGDLSFYRPKPRNNGRPALVQIEFNELYEITHDPDAS